MLLYRTALLVAATEGFIKLVELLLERGADLSATLHDTKNTPLLEAVSNGHRDCSEALLTALLASGQDLEYTNVHGHTALLSAAVKGSVGCIELLISKGAVITKVDKQGRSSLMLAAFMGHHASVGMLLKHGANTEGRCDMDRTALLWALAAGAKSVDCLELLVDHGYAASRGLACIYVGSDCSTDAFRCRVYSCNLKVKDREKTSWESFKKGQGKIANVEGKTTRPRAAG